MRRLGPALALLALLLAACATDGGSASGSSAPSAPARASLPAPTDPPNAEAVSAALVGLTQTEAEARAGAAGYTTRIASVDGQPRALTMDYSASRVNLDVADGRVAAVTVG